MVLLFSSVGLSACIAKPTQPTSAPTVEPIPIKVDIATTLGLNSERIYQVNGKYLVDQFNMAPKAILQEDGTWKKLDYSNPEEAEIMYGFLALKSDPYIQGDGSLYTLDVIGGLKHYLVIPRYVDWETEQITYQGGSVELVYLVTVLRDTDEDLHVVKIPMDAPDYKAPHGALYICDFSKSQTERTLVTLPHLLDQLRVGEPIGLEIFLSDQVSVQSFTPPPGTTAIEDSNIQAIMVSELYNSRPDWRLTDAEKALIGKMQWPDRVVTLGIPDRIEELTVHTAPIIYRVLLADCPRWKPTE